MNPETPAGFAVICDLQGIVERVIRDDLALGERIAPGQMLTRLVDRGSFGKALSFLVEVKAQGAAFDWEMNVAAGETVRPLHFTGGAVAEALLIVGAASSQRALQLYAELLRVINEQANLLRAAVKERDAGELPQAEGGHTVYDEISRLNNDLVNLQRELAQINAELEKRVAARTAELVAANAELLQANRLKDEFLANMSHELRTPLTAILGLSEALQMGNYGPLPEKQAQMLQVIRQSGQHLLGLITDILDLSKIEAGKLRLQLAPTPVTDLCEVSLQSIRPAAQKKNIRVTFASDPEVRLLQADARRLKQMLVNLLGNAVKFTPEGGQIGLEVTSGVAAGAPPEREVRFTVWDTGIGIPPEKQALLFRPFVQVDGSLARKYEGTGLGLALTRRLAEAHGGRVSVESLGAGQGSRFTLTLPWRPAETASG